MNHLRSNFKAVKQHDSSNYENIFKNNITFIHRPLQSFQAIIKAGELANSVDQSTMASPNSPSSPSLATTDSSAACNQEINRDSQVKTKQILKREVNIQEIQNLKVFILSC